MTLEIASHGGGVQSTAMLVLAAQRAISPRVFLFANVGDNAENPGTQTYLRDVALPFAEAHGIELRSVAWIDRSGRQRDLYDDMHRLDRDVPIPVRLDSGAFGNRKCTARYKIEVVAKEARRLGATVDDPAEIALGISVDEIQRAKPGVVKQQPWTCRVYPLLDLGLTRDDCHRVIAEAGLPDPPKSSCWFCPYQGAVQWRRRREEEPELYRKAVALDAMLSKRHERLRGRQATIFAEHGDDCDSGFCFT